MILILSSPHDIHARAVLRELEDLGARAEILDLSRFPQQLALELEYRSGDHGGRLGGNGAAIDLAAVDAVWWRRPQAYGLHPEIRDGPYAPFTYGECQEALAGVWQILADRARWINDLNRDERAHRKAYQLRVAQQVGLELPDTLITTDPDAAARFIDRHGHERVVYKAFSATERDWRETRILREDEMELIDSVRYAPVIFQQYVDAEVDLRVTAVGDRLFAAAIHSQQTAYKADFRMDMANAHIEAAELPAEVEAGLLDLQRRLGLVYGAIDLRRTPDGRHVFLEVNPAGQWLFVEQETAQPIARALAEALIA